MQAFLSYTRIDDKLFGGGITSRGHAIERGVQVITEDKQFRVIQDLDLISLDHEWKQQHLDAALTIAIIFIPVITPRFFSYDICMYQLQQFRWKERKLGRNDLILPIYFATPPTFRIPAKEIRILSFKKSEIGDIAIGGRMRVCQYVIRKFLWKC